MKINGREYGGDPAKVEAHVVARLKLDTFCLNVMAKYREQLIYPPLTELIVMSMQPYGYMTRQVLGHWVLPDTERNDLLLLLHGSITRRMH